MAKLALQNRQQIGNDIQALRQEPNSLVHLEIAAYGLVHRFEMGFHPEQLWRVEHRTVEMDIDAEDKQLADLHVDLTARHCDLTRKRNLGRDIFASLDSGSE